MISFVISFVEIQPWSHNILDSIVEFTSEFKMWIHLCFSNHELNSRTYRRMHDYEFWHMISQYSSWFIHEFISWTHTRIPSSWSWIHMLLFMTHKFRYEFMYIKNIVRNVYSAKSFFHQQSGESRCIFLPISHITFMLTYLAYFCIFCAYKCIWMHRRNTYGVTAYFAYFVRIYACLNLRVYSSI